MSALVEWLAENPEHRQHVQFCRECAEADRLAATILTRGRCDDTTTTTEEGTT